MDSIFHFDHITATILVLGLLINSFFYIALHTDLIGDVNDPKDQQ